MSSAFVRESGGVPQVFASRESAESAAEIQRAMEGNDYDFEVRERGRGGYRTGRSTPRSRSDHRTRIARKSLTLVPVGPVMKSPPTARKAL